MFSFAEWLMLSLLDASVKAALLLIVAWAAMACWNVRNAHAQHRLWLLVLIGMLALPLLVTRGPRLALPLGSVDLQWPDSRQKFSTEPRTSADRAERPNAAAGATSMPADAVRFTAVPPELTQADLPSAPVHGSISEVTWPRLVTGMALIYLGGVVWSMSRTGIGIILASRMVQRSCSLSTCEAITRLSLPGRVIQSNEVLVPVTIGYLRPVIVLPADWVTWGESSVKSVLAHEAVHIRRHDTWVLLLAALNSSIYWFHPAAWFIRRRLGELAEQICDDEVIRQLDDRTEYASNLLGLAARLSSGRGRLQPLGVAMASKANVEQRIEAILDTQRPLATKLGRWRAIIMAVITAACVITIAGLHPARHAQAMPQNEAAQQGTSQSTDAAKGDQSEEGEVSRGEAEPGADAEQANVRIDDDRAEINIRGAVTDEAGKPVNNAKLWLRIGPTDDRTVEAATDSQGEFTLRVSTAWLKPGRYFTGWTVWCHAAGYQIASASASRQLNRRSKTPLVLSLKAATDTGFMVAGPDGKPVVGAIVEPSRILTQAGYELVLKPLRANVRGLTDEQGRAMLRAVGRDTLFTVQVDAQGYGTQELRLSHSGDVPAIRNITLRATGRLEGRLVTDNPKILNAVRMGIDQKDFVGKQTSGVAPVEIDADGRFVVPHFAAGPIQLIIGIDTLLDEDVPLRPRIPEDLWIRAGQTTTVEVPFESTVRVRGRLQARGAARGLDGAHISVQYGTFRQSESVITDADGCFEANVLAGPVRQQVISRPQAYQSWIEKDAGWQTPISVPTGVSSFDLPPIELIETTVRSGWLLDHADKPLAAKTVAAVIGARVYSTAITDDNGGFELRLPSDLQIENYRVRGSAAQSAASATVIQQSPLILRLWRIP